MGHDSEGSKENNEGRRRDQLGARAQLHEAMINALVVVVMKLENETSA